MSKFHKTKHDTRQDQKKGTGIFKDSWFNIDNIELIEPDGDLYFVQFTSGKSRYVKKEDIEAALK